MTNLVKVSGILKILFGSALTCDLLTHMRSIAVISKNELEVLKSVLLWLRQMLIIFFPAAVSSCGTQSSSFKGKQSQHNDIPEDLKES